MPKVKGPQWVGTGATATGTTSLSIAEPSGVVADDIVIVNFAHRGAGFATVPGGWTLIDRDIDGQGVRGEWYWFRSAGAAGPYSITGLANSAVGYCHAWRGCLKTGNPINVQTKRVNASGANGAPAITTTDPNQIVLMFTSTGKTLVGAQFGVVHGPMLTLDATYSLDPELAAMSSLATVFNSAGDDVAMACARQIKTIPGSTIDDFRIRVWQNGPFDNLCMVAAILPETSGDTAGTRYYTPPLVPVAPRREPWAAQGDWAPIAWFDGPLQRHIVTTSMLSQTLTYDGFYNHITNDGDQLATNQQGDYDILYRRFITPPLQAQTLAGTFQCTLGFNVRWKNALGVLSNASVARLKIHAYVTVGQTTEVRSVIPSLDNFVDPANINNANNNVVWTGLSTPADLSGVVIEEGDSIVFEIGTRIVSSPTPAPTYPPTEWTRVQMMIINGGSIGVAATADGVIGNTAVTPQTQLAHLDFTDTILEQDWVPPSPTNISPETAKEIITPYSEIDAPYNTHGSTANSRTVWYKHTATRTGTLILTARGTHGFVRIDTYTGGPNYASLQAHSPLGSFRAGDHSLMRCTSFARVLVEEGETYYFQVIGDAEPGFAGVASVLSINAAYQEAPASGDKFLPNQWVYVFRGRHVVNLNYLIDNFAPTGIAIDYTRRELDSFPTPNTNYRMYIALFGFPVIEIFDLTDVNNEVSFIGDPLELASGRGTGHLAALHMTRESGMLYVQTFGNGFLLPVGFELGIQSYLSSLPNFDDLGYVRGMDGAHTDTQPGNPWPLAAEYPAEMEQTGPWHGGLNENTGVLYYSSGGLSFTLPAPFPTTPGNGQVAKRFNVFGNTQGSDLATLPAMGSSQGLKGMCVNTDGSVFVTNGSQMVRLDPDTGAVITTYTPTSDYPVILIDTHLDPDGVHVWAWDYGAGDWFQFNIATGVQTDRIRVFGAIGSTIQFAIFTPETPPVPVPPLESEIRYIRRLRQAPHLSEEQRIVRYNRFWLDLEAGIGTTEGQGVDPICYISWSDDGGHRWSNEYPMYAGKLGKYKWRAMRRRLGSSRDRIFRITMSDPVNWVLLDAYLDVDPGTT